MKYVTIAEYTDDSGVKRSAVQWGEACQPITPERPNWQTEATEYARAVYHKERGPKTLRHWNGDTATMTVLDTEK